MGITKEDLEKLREEVLSNKRGAVPEVHIVSQKQYDLMKKSYEETGSPWSWLK